MGIQVEYNPDLALRNIEHYHKGDRLLEECIPDPLEVDKAYDFLKSGQRNYWLMGEQPLLQTQGKGKLSSPLASIVILEVTHFLKEGQLYTKGKYMVKEVFDKNDETIRFNGFNKVD